MGPGQSALAGHVFVTFIEGEPFTQRSDRRTDALSSALLPSVSAPLGLTWLTSR
jgi:hypothetical protein